MDRAEFLRGTPREIDGLLERVAERERRAMVPAALICSVMANIKRDPDQRPEAFTISDFLPSEDGKSEEEEMIEFIDAIQRGEKFEVDPDQLAAFKRSLETEFKNVKPCST